MERTLSSEEEQTSQEEEDTSSATEEAEENDSNSEEDTSTNDSNEDDEEEETVTLTKEEHQKLIAERDNYKQGLLSAKGKKRGDEGLTKEVKSDVNEDAVNKVLSKREERKALSNTIDSKHPDYIPELVDDNQYQEIIGYLPRNVDKTSYDSIIRGLKIATKMWKEERGIQDKSPKKNTNLQTSKSATTSSETKTRKTGRKILKTGGGVDTWY